MHDTDTLTRGSSTADHLRNAGLVVVGAWLVSRLARNGGETITSIAGMVFAYMVLRGLGVIG